MAPNTIPSSLMAAEPKKTCISPLSVFGIVGGILRQRDLKTNDYVSTTDSKIIAGFINSFDLEDVNEGRQQEDSPAREIALLNVKIVNPETKLWLF